MPLVRQSTSYSCGAAALQSVLGYYGNEDYDESDLMKLLGTNPEWGTVLEDMAKFAEEQGLRTRIASNQTLAQLRAHIAKNQAVIIEAQAWQEDDIETPYPDDWESGHYMVVIGVDDKNVYFMDPSLLGSRGFIPAHEFLERWHDISIAGKKLQRTALYFEGKPKPAPAWQYVP